MNFDWLATLIPIVNATGIPLLAIGIIFLLRAYQKSVEAYKETSLHLTEENKRLRNQLSEADAGYIEALNRMREIATKSIQASGELQAAKVNLLTNPGDIPKDGIQSEVEKIDKVLELLDDLVVSAGRIENYQKEVEFGLQHELNRIGKLLSEIGDTQSRLSIVRVIASEETFQSLNSKLDKQKRGLFFEPERNWNSLTSPEREKFIENLREEYDISPKELKETESSKSLPEGEKSAFVVEHK